MASAQDLTIEEKLAALYKLQTIDSKIDKVRILRGELPMEVSDLEDELTGLNTRVENLENEVAGYNQAITDNQNGIKEAEALIAKYEQQQNNVRNNREFDAITKEMELQNLEIQLCNKKIKDATTAIEDKKDYLTESKDQCEKLAAALEEKKGELDKISKETEAEEQGLQAESDKAKGMIEDRLIKAYDRLRNNYKNGLAVVMVERDACGGCFAKVPPQRKLEISQRKKIIVCEHCGRILVDKQDDSE